jgi:hypothetical protein
MPISRRNAPAAAAREGAKPHVSAIPTATGQAGVLGLQRAVGNAAVGRLLSRDGGEAGTVRRALSQANQAGVGFGHRTGQGGRVEAAWMKTDGTLQGNVPQADPPGYDYIRQLQLTNFWIRFHLVNNEAGGPGVVGNLVPSSKRDNSNYEINVESDVKDSVDTAAMNNGLVFFGAEVTYGGAAAGTQAQRNAAPFFPTRITYYHQEHDGNAWSWVTNGGTFDFQDGQPADPGASIALSAITGQQLRQRVFNYNWDANDVAFINSLGGARKADFEELIDDYAALGPEESAASALDQIDYGQTTFGERIGNAAAIQALGRAIAQGFLTIN